MRPIFTEITGIENGRDITRGFVGNIGFYIPTTDPILTLKSGGDLTLYEQVAQDDRVKSCLQQRFSALISRKFEILPGGDKPIDKKAAEWLSAQVQALNWDDITEKQLWGVFYGYSVAECMFAKEGDKVVLKDVLVRNRRRFRFGIDKKPRLLSLQDPMGEELPENKFWYFSCGADNHDEPYGRGLAHWLYWLTWFKRNDWRWWIAFLENFAEPTKVGKYPNGATDSEKKTLQDAVQALGTKKWATIPEGMLLELLEASRSGTADYSALNDTINSAIATVILSQTMTTEDGSSLSQAKVHQDVADAVVAEDANLIGESFTNSVATWLTEWNFPGAAIPKCQWKLEGDPDLKALAERDKIIVDMGFPANPDYIVETYGEGFKQIEEESVPVTLNGAQLQAFVTLVTQAKQTGWNAEMIQISLQIAFPHVPDVLLERMAKSVEASPAIDPNQPNAAMMGQQPQQPQQPISPEESAKSLDTAAAMFAATPELHTALSVKQQALKEKINANTNKI